MRGPDVGVDCGVQNELPIRKLMQYPANCAVVLAFDTSKEMTEHLKENPKLMWAAKTCILKRTMYRT